MSAANMSGQSLFPAEFESINVSSGLATFVEVRLLVIKNRDPDGKPAHMLLMLVVYPGVAVAELGVAWDLVNAAGWSDVYCISSLARARPAEPPAPPPPPVRVKRR